MFRAFLLVLALVLPLAGCSLAGDTTAAEQDVVKFHSMLDAGQYDAIYDSSSKHMKDVSTKENMVSLLSAVHDKLGNVQSNIRTGWSANYDTNGTHIVLTYKTTFARGDAEERFDFRKDSTELVLSGYHINSNALVTR